ncbi:MAG: hypothetical protein JW829_04755 [Pirellulales bacterium]|nr:hypothetical protein [Pirellulales bacterium]
MNELILYFASQCKSVIVLIGSLGCIGLVLLAVCTWYDGDSMATRDAMPLSGPDLQLPADSLIAWSLRAPATGQQASPSDDAEISSKLQTSGTGATTRVRPAAMFTSDSASSISDYQTTIHRLPPVDELIEIQRLPPISIPPVQADESDIPCFDWEIPEHGTDEDDLSSVSEDTEVVPLPTEPNTPDPLNPEPLESGPAPLLTADKDSKADHEQVSAPKEDIPPLVTSPDTLQVHRSAVERIVQQAFSQANQGLCYSARREFLHALRMLAQARDASVGGRESSHKLTAGIRAIDEADDFRLRNSLEYEMDLPSIVSAHRTPILQGQETRNISPPAAIEAYLDYAAEQLGAAVAGEPAGSMALYGLARIQDYLSTKEMTDAMANTERAIVLHRAALLAHPGNHLAANEAGVLLARQGRWMKAASMLQRAVHLAPTTVGYHNLAIVQKQQGLHAQAAESSRRAEYLAMQQGTAALANQNGVIWVDSEVLAKGRVPGHSNVRVARVSEKPQYSAPIPPVAPPNTQWIHPVWQR